MSGCMNGLSTVNIELTTRCSKSCWMCGRRKVEPAPLDMDFCWHINSPVPPSQIDGVGIGGRQAYGPVGCERFVVNDR